jgi:hypothetical protein
MRSTSGASPPRSCERETQRDIRAHVGRQGIRDRELALECLESLRRVPPEEGEAQPLLESCLLGPAALDERLPARRDRALSLLPLLQLCKRADEQRPRAIPIDARRALDGMAGSGCRALRIPEGGEFACPLQPARAVRGIGNGERSGHERVGVDGYVEVLGLERTRPNDRLSEVVVAVSGVEGCPDPLGRSPRGQGELSNGPGAVVLSEEGLQARGIRASNRDVAMPVGHNAVEQHAAGHENLEVSCNIEAVVAEPSDVTLEHREPARSVSGHRAEHEVVGDDRDLVWVVS